MAKVWIYILFVLIDGKHTFTAMPVWVDERLFLLMPVAMNHTYVPTLPTFFSLYKASYVIIQAYKQPLPGSCNFESDTCGYTSDTDFSSWTLHKDGKGRL